MECSDLTVGEISTLSEFPRKEIKKYIDTKVVSAQKSNGQYLLPKEAVLFFSVIGNEDIKDAPKNFKKAIWKTLQNLLDPTEVVHVEGKDIHLDPSIKDLLKSTERYIQNRSEFLVENPRILGGTPVIKGTRITAYSVRGWLKGEETIDNLVEEYPEIPPEAFEVAEFYAKSNPLRGRRKGLPI